MATRSTTSEYQPAPPHNRQQRGGGRKAGKQAQNVKVQRQATGANRPNSTIMPIRHMGDTGERVVDDARNVTVHPSVNATSE